MTRHDPREPLDADERELAGRLSRLGADGPSPALDAKILAAARAAAAPRSARTRRHWLAWASIPPAAITGVGVAAACVLALGVVWQMRPRTAMVPAAEESSEEVFIVADAAPARAPVSNPPPVEQSADAAAVPAADAAANAAPSVRERAATPTAPEPAPAPAAAAAPPAEVAADGFSGARESAPQAFAGNAGVAPASAAADAAAATAAEKAQASASAAEDRRAAEEAAAEADASATAAKVRRPTYTTTARATAERSHRVQPFAPPPAPAAAPARQETSTYSTDPQRQAGSELDRVEVTGSRLGDFDPKALAGLAPSEDRHLDREDWLLRIRARRDAGDITGARESLRLFRKQYPRVHLPEDLRKLAFDTSP